MGSNNQANDDDDLTTNDVKPVNNNIDATNDDIPSNDEVSVSWTKSFYDYLTNDIITAQILSTSLQRIKHSERNSSRDNPDYNHHNHRTTSESVELISQSHSIQINYYNNALILRLYPYKIL